MYFCLSLLHSIERFRSIYKKGQSEIDTWLTQIFLFDEIPRM